ncbi:hypothetical protein [Microvirga arabica]|uniref:hypothetical protein n=1 Tax=Microvirga arabica TaxID=1128671 RepID=UPI001939CA39|nr:hypothetical protein [Microvirga arabica]MBM1171479.1 hypothetical protein [Microvirga arabica]
MPSQPAIAAARTASAGSGTGMGDVQEAFDRATGLWGANAIDVAVDHPALPQRITCLSSKREQRP